MHPSQPPMDHTEPVSTCQDEKVQTEAVTVATATVVAAKTTTITTTTKPTRKSENEIVSSSSSSPRQQHGTGHNASSSSVPQQTQLSIQMSHRSSTDVRKEVDEEDGDNDDPRSFSRELYHNNRRNRHYDLDKRQSSLLVLSDPPPSPPPQDRQWQPRQQQKQKQQPQPQDASSSPPTLTPPPPPPRRRRRGSSISSGGGNGPRNRQTFLTSVDLNTIEKLDADYERALLQREIGWNARYISVRQNAGLSLWFFFVFLMCGTIFFDINTDWTLGESLLFSVYTITTVGYGNHVIPNKPSVLIFICFYIFIGIALLTILAAQLYQWITLEITWAQYKRDSSNFLKRHRQSIQNAQYLEATMVGELPIRIHPKAAQGMEDEMMEGAEYSCQDRLFESGLKFLNWIQGYIKDNPAGQLMVVLVPFFVLILLGAAVVGSVQGWDIHESIYFAVVSMTTVGFGDYYPSELASTWFCIFWLPFSVGFLSLYLGSVAQLYLHISTQNVKRVESNLRNRINKVKRAEERERAEAIARMTSGGFDMGSVGDVGRVAGRGDHDNHVQDVIPDHLNRNKRRNGHDGFVMLPESPSMEQYHVNDNSSLRQRRDNILHNSKSSIPSDDEEVSGETMKSMKHVIVAVKQNITSPRRMQEEIETVDIKQRGDIVQSNPYLSLKSTRHYMTAQGIEKKPSFALRVLVQERFSKIIANEIAGYQSQVEIRNNTLSVTIDSLKQTADKWVIPRRARKAFRAVAFEVLYFVGERALIVNGADAVLELRPNEVQSLFAPLLAAFGDADTMEAWLVRTQIMAENELHEPCQEGKQLVFDRIMKNREAKITDNITATPSMKRNVIGNAVSNQM